MEEFAPPPGIQGQGWERKKERKKKNHLSDNSLLLAAQMFQPAVKGRIV